MIRPTLAFLLGLQLALPAAAISRIGKSSIGDPDDGFRALVAEEFVFYKPLALGGLVLTAPQALNSANSQWAPTALKLTRFRVEFPELTGLHREDLVQHMADNRPSWVPWSIGQACIAAYTYRGPQITTVLATWGEGRGVVISTGASLHERQSLRDVILSLELSDGACSWK